MKELNIILIVGIILLLSGCNSFNDNDKESLMKSLVRYNLNINDIQVDKNAVVIEVEDFEGTINSYYETIDKLNVVFVENTISETEEVLLDKEMMVLNLFNVVENQIKLSNENFILDYIVDKDTKYQLKKDNHTFVEKSTGSNKGIIFAENKLEKEYFELLEKKFETRNNNKKNKQDWIDEKPNDDLWEEVVESLYDIYGEE